LPWAWSGAYDPIRARLTLTPRQVPASVPAHARPQVAGVPLQDGMYNVFAIEHGTAVRIDDYAERRAAFEAAGLEPG
jgi:hypothetical protein